MAFLGAEELRLTPVRGHRDRPPARPFGRARRGAGADPSQAGGRLGGRVSSCCFVIRPMRFRPRTPIDVLFEYFAREVLGRADLELRNFLLLTAWLPSMTAAMARRLTGHPHVEPLLRSLSHGNFFLSRTAKRGDPRYRYHQLYRLFLLDQARSTWDPSEIGRIQRQAAAILEDAGQTDAAVALWRDAGDWDRLTDLIRGAAPDALARGRTQSLDAWLGGIPAAVVADRPWLLYWSGRARVHRDPIAARALFEQAYQGFKETRDAQGAYLAWAVVCETYWIALDGTDPLRQWLAELDVIRARWPGFPSAEIEVRVAFGAFFALNANDPRHPARDRWERCLLDALDGDEPPDLRLMIANLLMFHYVWTIGDRGRAARVLDRLRVLAADPTTAPLAVVIGRIWGDFAFESVFGGSVARCLEIAEEARAMAAERGTHLYDSILWSMPSYAHLTAGSFVEARPFVGKIRGILDSTRLFDRGLIHYLQAWEAWLDGRLAEALDAARTSLALAVRFGDLHPVWQTTLGLFQIELSLGHRARALRHLAELRQWWRRVGSRIARYGWALALAQLALESGRFERCRRILRRAFAIGREEGYIGIPWFTPETLARLCAQALEAGIEPDYARALIRKGGLTPPSGSQPTEHWPWPVRVTTFGGLSLTVDDAPVQWPRKAQHKPIDLLRTLIAHGGRRVPASWVVDELWPDAEGDAAASALKTTLHRLRRILGRDDALRLSDGQISINPDRVWVDRWALERLFQDQNEAAATPRAAPSRPELEAVSEHLFRLYTGRFLAKSDLPCAAKPRETLHRKYLRAVERLGAGFEALGMAEEAINCYEQALDMDPTAERIQQKLRSCIGTMKDSERP